MMKKTLFMRLYRPIYIGLLADMAVFVIGACLNYAAHLLMKNSIFGIMQCSKIVATSAYVLWHICMILTVLLIFIIFTEIINRFRNDDFTNLLKSIKRTEAIHLFLRRRDAPLQKIATGISVATNDDRVTREFNRSVSKCIVDIRNDKVTVLIRLPRTQQAQKIFTEIDSQLKEYLSNQMGNYYFSGATRIKGTLWFEGEKR